MNRKKILVVEDNALNLKLARAILQQRDYVVLEAEDAETGLDLALVGSETVNRIFTPPPTRSTVGPATNDA